MKGRQGEMKMAGSTILDGTKAHLGISLYSISKGCVNHPFCGVQIYETHKTSLDIVGKGDIIV